MNAVVMTAFGPSEVLQMQRHPVPEPGAGEVRVRVAAVVVNTTRDVVTRTGAGAFSRFVTPPHVLGGEHAGVVDAVGAGVDDGLRGRRVAVSASRYCGTCEWCESGREEVCAEIELVGIHLAGAYADYTVAPTSALFDLPDDLSFAEAAALLTTGPVAHAQLEAAEVAAGDVVIVTGASGALGSMLATLATRRGAVVVGVVRDLAQANAIRLSVDALADSTAPDLADALRTACGPGGAHAVIDNICLPPAWDACLELLRPRGRIVISGTLGSGEVRINSRRLYLANQALLGVRTGNLRAQDEFWQAVVDGFRIPSTLVQAFPLSTAAAVHDRVENATKHGHYVLTVA
jgi:D-arabinose 1-dehydrogenase-like Zn-dependent alcohol dehydrogenase